MIIKSLPHGCFPLPAQWNPSDHTTLQHSHHDPNKQEHPPLLHGSEVEPDVGQEGEGELHPGVEKQVDEVCSPDLLQFCMLCCRQVTQTGKLEQLDRVDVF